MGGARVGLNAAENFHNLRTFHFFRRFRIGSTGNRAENFQSRWKFSRILTYENISIPKLRISKGWKSRLRPYIMGSELRCQNFDLVKFREIIPRNPNLNAPRPSVMGPFFLRTLSQNSRKILIRRLSPNLSQNFGQILTRALGLTTWSELHLEVVSPRFEDIYGTREAERETADLSLSPSPP